MQYVVTAETKFPFREAENWSLKERDLPPTHMIPLDDHGRALPEWSWPSADDPATIVDYVDAPTAEAPHAQFEARLQDAMDERSVANRNAHGARTRAPSGKAINHAQTNQAVTLNGVRA